MPSFFSYQDFVTEEFYDVLKIGRGDNILDANSIELEASGPNRPPALTMDGNVFWMTFNTDADKTERGFSVYLTDQGYARK